MAAGDEESRSVCLEGDCVCVSSAFMVWFLCMPVECACVCVRERMTEALRNKRESGLKPR